MYVIAMCKCTVYAFNAYMFVQTDEFLYQMMNLIS